MIMKMRNMMKRKNGQKGFTLIELIVVMAILAVLAAIAVPKYQNVSDSAKVSAAMSNHKLVISAVSLAQAQNNGTLPGDGITSLNNYITGGSAALSEIATTTWSVSGTTGTIVTTVDKQSDKYPASTKGNVVITRGEGTTIFTTTITE